VFAPLGVATRVEGGYRVRGRWPFASGCRHASHVMGGAMLATDAGKPVPLSVLFESSQVRIHDTWDTSGLRGTGSHDFEAEDVFVPDSHVFSLFGRPRHDAPLYRQPFFGLLASGVAAVTLGIARGAIDALVELAAVKTPGGAKRTIAHRELVQRDVARADGMVRAARSRLLESVAEAAAEVAATGQASVLTRAHVRIAACHAASEAARAVDLAYEAGGGSSIYARSPLQRAFRDVHTATQHVMVSASAATMAGRVLLGVEGDLSTL
jgi:indole-3-acetate monooxygenase